MKPVFGGGESENTYQALCEGFELTVSFEALLFKNTCENQSIMQRGNSFLTLTPQIVNPVPRSVGDI